MSGGFWLPLFLPTSAGLDKYPRGRYALLLLSRNIYGAGNALPDDNLAVRINPHQKSARRKDRING
jgi:hypothetical protein